MRLVLMMAFFCLSGCWMGTDFYRGVRPQQPIPAGDYLLHENGRDQPLPIRIELLPDHTTRVTNLGVTDDREQFTVSFFPLPAERDKLVVRVTAGNGQTAPANRILYAVIQRVPDGSFLVGLPMCDQTQEFAIANHAGVVHDDPAFPFCVFPRRADLERALKALPASILGESRLVPVAAGR